MNALAGIGLKDEHALPLLEGAAAVDFLEVHAENCMVAGGPRLRRLERLREQLPLSIHGVGLSIGGLAPLDPAHLEALARLLDRFQPRWFSEHLAWSSHGGRWFNDLLPVSYDEATLERVCEHVDRVQTRLRRRLLLENPSTYLAFDGSSMDEGAFIAEVLRRTGCGVLLDVNNAYVSGVNHGRDPWALIEALPAEAVGEIHLAGFAEDRDAAGARLLIDHHGAPVDAAVWSLYERALARLGPVPTLIERDNDVPALAVLAAEAGRARAALRAVSSGLVSRSGSAGLLNPRGGRTTYVVGLGALGETAEHAAPLPSPHRRAPSAQGSPVSTFAPHAFAAALLDPQRRLPPGLSAWNGSDPATRFAVHRNNVTVSLVAALAETFPVVRRLVGCEFFDAMAALHVRAHPPTSPVLADYGAGFAVWLEGFAPARALPYLADMARLEHARVLAFHAADVPPLPTTEIAARLADAQQLPGSWPVLHPSCRVLRSPFAVDALWAAHQQDIEMPPTDVDRPGAALVLRDAGDEVLVVPLTETAAAFCAALQRGNTLAEAVQEAEAEAAGAGFDLADTLALLLRHGAIVSWHTPTETTAP